MSKSKKQWREHAMKLHPCVICGKDMGLFTYGAKYCKKPACQEAKKEIYKDRKKEYLKKYYAKMKSRA